MEGRIATPPTTRCAKKRKAKQVGIGVEIAIQARPEPSATNCSHVRVSHATVATGVMGGSILMGGRGGL
jgi:hypothetical protein